VAPSAESGAQLPAGELAPLTAFANLDRATEPDARRSIELILNRPLADDEGELVASSF
jgi:hypothetical protein